MHVIRALTERMEGVEAGAAELVPLDTDRIVSAVSARLNAATTRLPDALNAIYGDGRAGIRSACFIAEFLSLSGRCIWVDKQEEEFHYSAPNLLVVPRLVDSKNNTALINAIGTLDLMTLSEHPNQVFKKRFEKGRISIVLTQYKRNTTEIQLRAILRQTAAEQISRIVILQNEAHVDLSFLDNIDFSSDALFTGPSFKSNIRNLIQVVKSPNWNTKYYGRFALALMFDSEFCAILDDDTIPQPRFLEAAMALSAERNAIVGPVGVIISDDKQLFVSPPANAHIEVMLL